MRVRQMVSLLIPDATAQLAVYNAFQDPSASQSVVLKAPAFTTLDMFDASGATEGQPSLVYRETLVAQYPMYLGRSAAISALACAAVPVSASRISLGADKEIAPVFIKLKEQLRPFVRLLTRISPEELYLGAEGNMHGDVLREKIIASFFAGFKIARSVLTPPTPTSMARSEVAGAVLHRALVAVLGISMCRNTAALHSMLLAEMARAPIVFACARCFKEFKWMEDTYPGKHTVVKPAVDFGNIYVDDAAAADILCEAELSTKLTNVPTPPRAVNLGEIAVVDRVVIASEGKEPRAGGAAAVGGAAPSVAPAISVFDEVASLVGGSSGDGALGGAGKVATTPEPTPIEGNVVFADGLLSLEVHDGIAELRVLPGDAIALCVSGTRDARSLNNVLFFAPPKEALPVMDRLARIALEPYYNKFFHDMAVEGALGATVATVFDSHDTAWQYLCNSKQKCSIVLLSQGIILRRDQDVPGLQWRVCFNTARDAVDRLPLDALVLLADEMDIKLSAFPATHSVISGVLRFAMRVARDSCVGATDSSVTNDTIVAWFRAYRMMATGGEVEKTGAACTAVAKALHALGEIELPESPAGMVGLLNTLLATPESEGMRHLISYLNSSDTLRRSSDLAHLLENLQSEGKAREALLGFAECVFYNTTVSLFPLAAVLSKTFLARSR